MSRIVPPPEYGERVRLALAALPGTRAEQAAALGATVEQTSRWAHGTYAPEDPAPLARALGIDPGLLVYGPTVRLRVVLAGRAVDLGAPAGQYGPDRGSAPPSGPGGARPLR